MTSHPRALSLLLPCCLALFADAAFGQSLSIVKKGTNEFWIEAAAPADTRYRLQSSADLQNWMDITNDVGGQFEYRLDNAGVTARFFWLTPVPPILVVLLGDSTVMDCCGWGQALPAYAQVDVRVVNLAEPAYSTSVLLASDQYPQMVTIKPDFVLVQFGREDWGGCGGDPDRCKTTTREFGDNLRTIVQTVRGFNGTPILITPPVVRVFDTLGKVVPIYQDYNAMMKIVATELQTPLVDLNQMSMDLFNVLGDSGTADLFWDDHVHFTAKGAGLVAGLVVRALPNSLRPYFVAGTNTTHYTKEVPKQPN